MTRSRQFVMAVLLASIGPAGCGRTQETAKLRQTMASSDSAACNSNAKLHAMASNGQVASYCRCMVETQLNGMSDADVQTAASNAAHNVSDPNDRARLMAAKQSCGPKLRSDQ